MNYRESNPRVEMTFLRRVNEFSGIITIIMILIGAGFYFGKDRVSIDGLQARIGSLETKFEVLNQNLLINQNMLAHMQETLLLHMQENVKK